MSYYQYNSVVDMCGGSIALQIAHYMKVHQYTAYNTADNMVARVIYTTGARCPKVLT